MDGRVLAQRVNLLRPWLQGRFGGEVVKIGLDAGLGCPHRAGGTGAGGCAFCPPHGSGRGQGGEPIAEQLARGLARLAGHRRPAKALAYFQAYTSTWAPVSHLAALYRQALAVDGVAGLVIATRPDCIDEAVWELLAGLQQRAPLWLELGLQSAHDRTLRAIGRGHDVACFDAAVSRARQAGIKVVAHVILGLPGEEPRHTEATADHLARLGVWGVKLHNLMILQGAPLARRHAAGEMVCWSRETYALAAARFLARLPRSTLVHRLAADPGPDRLLAPDWAADKDGVLAALAAAMVQHDLEQGSLCQISH